MDDWQVLKKHKYKLFFPIIVQAGEFWTVLIFALGWNKSKNLKLSKYLFEAVFTHSSGLPVTGSPCTTPPSYSQYTVQYLHHFALLWQITKFTV